MLPPFAEFGTNSCESAGIQISAFKSVWRLTFMSALKVARNIVGTAGLLFAGYVFLISLKDSARYIKISSM